ncbi:Glycosyltransferase family 6 [uncultured archaeon]|nr:Glycosyltransferase family 6 [uncultured archaeon]
MKIVLITIADGAAYWDYARNMFASAKEYFPRHDQITFTERPFKATSTFLRGNEYHLQIASRGYPGATLYRYHAFLQYEHWLNKYDYVFYCDADMEFVAPVGDIFAPLVAVLHPGYLGTRGTPEDRPQSAAYCTNNGAYYAGGFQGGESVAYLSAAKDMAGKITEDALRQITAVWHDESHWNHYLANLPTNDRLLALGPSYCFPEGSKQAYPPILIALDKRKRGNHPRFPSAC